MTGMMNTPRRLGPNLLRSTSLLPTGRLLLCLALAIGSLALPAMESHGSLLQAPLFQTTVGVPLQLDQVVIPGGLLEAKPITDRRQPLVVRIVNSYVHGDAHRYDLEVYGLEAGNYNVMNYLQRVGGEPLSDVPEFIVHIASTLPAGQIVPREVPSNPAPRLGGYQATLIIGGLVWLLGLGLLIWARRPAATGTLEDAKPAPTVADRLRPLVRAALSGSLTSGQRAELERVLIAYWCKKLNLTEHRPGDVMATLRAHPEAGKLIRRLEDWLHRPGATADPQEWESLLVAYQDVEDPDDATPIDPPAARATSPASTLSS